MKTKFVLLISAFAALVGCDWMHKKDAASAKSEKELAQAREERIHQACGSAATYDKLKALVFDQAARIRNSDPRNLDPIAAASVVRMEKPVVKSRDEELDVTVCTGRFIMELPPGAENAFDGMRRVSADVEYSAQAAADGSGLVYQMDGAEPIVYRLATFGMNGQPMPRVAAAQPVPAAVPAVVPVPAAAPAPVPAPAPAPAPAPPVRQAAAEPPPPPPARPDRGQSAQQQGRGPSFNCRYARTGTERLVCNSPELAAKDRQMASIYYRAMANSDPGTQAHLRRSRDAFLGRRERCGSEACVLSAYSARISEIRSVTEGH